MLVAAAKTGKAALQARWVCTASRVLRHLLCAWCRAGLQRRDEVWSLLGGLAWEERLVRSGSASGQKPVLPGSVEAAALVPAVRTDGQVVSGPGLWKRAALCEDLV